MKRLFSFAWLLSLWECASGNTFGPWTRSSISQGCWCFACNTFRCHFFSHIVALLVLWRGSCGAIPSSVINNGIELVSDVTWTRDEFGVYIKFISTIVASTAKRNNVVLLIVASDFLDMRTHKVTCPFPAVRCTASIRFSLGLIFPVSKPTCVACWRSGVKTRSVNVFYFNHNFFSVKLFNAIPW